MIEYWQPLLLVVCGMVAGFMNVMAAGGSMITVPVLVFLGLPGPVANGTNRIAIVAQSLTAVTTFFRKGFSDFRLSFTLALCSVPGAIMGALVGVRLEGVWFTRVLAAVMLMVMVLSWRKQAPFEEHQEQLPSTARLVVAHVLMVMVGFYGGFIQIGVGFLLMPVLQHVLKLNLVRVNMHKVFIAGVFNSVALLVYAMNVPLMWLLGLSLAVGNSIGGWFGAHTSITRGERVIRWMLNIVLAFFIGKLLYQSF